MDPERKKFEWYYHLSIMPSSRNRFFSKKNADGGIRISVKDRGIGMEPEQVKTIVDGADVKS